ncbi:DUF1801 domain-containing protein [Octadecabacter sp. R77987]|uniref:DUF1801 domain-containing protein n=1 Tax=Octadecabacter sp. R77987 TaxID=3093874 RepID=UPI00366DB8F2
MTPEIAAVLDAQPALTAQGMARLRDLILETAVSDPRVGPLSESLKWGQPAFRPKAANTGTTLRVAAHKDAAFALYAPCSTTVIPTHAERFAGADRIDGTRAILFDHPDQIDADRLRLTILHGLTYFL